MLIFSGYDQAVVDGKSVFSAHYSNESIQTLDDFFSHELLNQFRENDGSLPENLTILGHSGLRTFSGRSPKEFADLFINAIIKISEFQPQVKDKLKSIDIISCGAGMIARDISYDDNLRSFTLRFASMIEERLNKESGFNIEVRSFSNLELTDTQITEQQMKLQLMHSATPQSHQFIEKEWSNVYHQDQIYAIKVHPDTSSNSYVVNASLHKSISKSTDFMTEQVSQLDEQNGQLTEKLLTLRSQLSGVEINISSQIEAKKSFQSVIDFLPKIGNLSEETLQLENELNELKLEKAIFLRKASYIQWRLDALPQSSKAIAEIQQNILLLKSEQEKLVQSFKFMKHSVRDQIKDIEQNLKPGDELTEDDNYIRLKASYNNDKQTMHAKYEDLELKIIQYETSISKIEKAREAYSLQHNISDIDATVRASLEKQLLESKTIKPVEDIGLMIQLLNSENDELLEKISSLDHKLEQVELDQITYDSLVEQKKLIKSKAQAIGQDSFDPENNKSHQLIQQTYDELVEKINHITSKYVDTLKDGKLVGKLSEEKTLLLSKLEHNKSEIVKLKNEPMYQLEGKIKLKEQQLNEKQLMLAETKTKLEQKTELVKLYCQENQHKLPKLKEQLIQKTEQLEQKQSAYKQVASQIKEIRVKGEAKLERKENLLVEQKLIEDILTQNETDIVEKIKPIIKKSELFPKIKQKWAETSGQYQEDDTKFIKNELIAIYQSKISQLESNVSTLKSSFDSLVGVRATLNSDVVALLNDVEELESSINSLNAGGLIDEYQKTHNEQVGIHRKLLQSSRKLDHLESAFVYSTNPRESLAKETNNFTQMIRLSRYSEIKTEYSQQAAGLLFSTYPMQRNQDLSISYNA
ncbi:MAG: hypothetical protein EP298_04080 [Gammaproteobacteria bacterium]|nr:MAG: hypothetical protein EP298_04080 [Gammaproteobacteria bacterium]UTW43809.1 hypothetical protein KFE69_06890 [bacterium SCSIO 12844]